MQSLKAKVLCSVFLVLFYPMAAAHATIQWANNATSVIADVGGITAKSTSITVTTGHGDRFPAVADPHYFMITLVDSSGNREIVKVTARSSGSNTMTIARAQEGTTARAFALGSLVELRVTKNALDELSKGSDIDFNVYVADASAADQKATTNSRSIQSLLNSIGTSKKATIVLPHTGTGNTTTYTIAQNADWSAYTNVTFKIVPGAVISHGAFNVTFGGAVEGETTEIFSGTGAITIPRATTQRILADTTLTVPTDFATLAAAFSYLDNYWISPSVTVTIAITAGEKTYTSPVIIKHPSGSSIKIEGAAPISTTMVSIGATGGSSGAWTVPITVSSSAGMATGQYAIITAATGTGNFYSINGCWKITNVAGNVVTLLSTLRSAAFPTMTVTGGAFIVPTTVLTMANGGIRASGVPLGGIKNVTINGTLLYGLSADKSGGSIYIDSNVGVSGFVYGVWASSGGSIDSSGKIVVSSASTDGIFASNAGTIQATTLAVSNGNTGNGISANTSSTIVAAAGSVSSGNGGDGFWTGTSGSIYTIGGRSYNNVGYGYYATRSNIKAIDSYAVGNAVGFAAATGGSIFATSSYATNNTGDGFLAHAGSMACEGSTATGNARGFVARGGGMMIADTLTATSNTGAGVFADFGSSLRAGSGTSTGGTIGFHANGGIIEATSSTATGNSTYGYRSENKGYIDASSSTAGTNTTKDYYALNFGLINVTSAIGSPTYTPQINAWNESGSEGSLIYNGTIVYGSGQERLLSRTIVALNANAHTTIYTVPTGYRCVLTKGVLIAGADAGTTDISIGANGTETDFLATTNLGLINAQYDAAILQPIPAANVLLNKSYASGTVLEIAVTNQAGGATNTLYLYGILYTN